MIAPSQPVAAPVADGPLALLHEVATAVVGMLFDPSERIYWGFLLATVVLAWAVRREQRGAGLPTTPGRVLGRSSALVSVTKLWRKLISIRPLNSDTAPANPSMNWPASMLRPCSSLGRENENTST